MKPKNVVQIHISRTREPAKPTKQDRERMAQKRRAESRLAEIEEKRIEAECSGVGL